MSNTFPHYRQLDQMDCGPTCLRMVAKYFGKHYSAQTLREKTQISREGVSMLGISEASEAIGFRSIGVKVSLEKLAQEVPLPCLLHWEQNHFVVLYKVDTSQSTLSRRLLSGIWGGRKSSVNLDPFLLDISRNISGEDRRDTETDQYIFHIADPASGLISYTSYEFKKHWLAGHNNGQIEGLALLLEPTSKFYQEEGDNTKEIEFNQLLSYLWNYKKLVVQLGIGILVGSGLSVLFPILTQSVVDVGIGTQNLPFIYLVLIAQMVLLGSTASVDFLRSWILLHISTRLNLTILSEFLSKLLRLPVSFFDAKHFGDIMQRIGDHHRIESFLTGQMLNTLFSIFNLVVFGFILAYYNLTIFLVAVGASILYAIWVVAFLSRRRFIDTQRFEVSARNQSQIIQLIHGMQDIKLSGSETSKRWEWEHTQAKLFKWNVKSLSLSQFQQAGALLINQSKNILITFLAAKAVVEGHLTLGGMMSIQYILAQFNAPVEQLLVFLQSWQDAQISLERLNEVQGLPDEEPTYEVKRKDWNQRQDIRISNLTYTYPGAGNEPVLKNINLTIKYGQTTAIVGMSGSGKTTLLKLLLRFYEPDKGTVLLQSIEPTSENNSPIDRNSRSELDLKRISHRAWRHQCGVVMQDGFIFSDTIARNICVTNDIIDQDRLYNAARIANIHNYIESLPLGYHTKIGAEGNGISQGQKQRILIARSVYKNPQLLLFDEATNALDSNNESVIVHNLKEFLQGRTVVIVAHRLSTVRHADQIVVMEKGEIVELGSHAELVLAKGKYLELISNQLELSSN